MTVTGVAERAGVSVGSIYRRFGGKERLVTALTERILDQREEYVREQLCHAEPSLPGIADSCTRALLRSFADSSNLFTELLRMRGAHTLDRGSGPSPRSTACCSKRLAPSPTRSGANDPRTALDTVARALLGACFHDSLRHDRPAGEAARIRHADELSGMAIAYLRTPGRRRPTHS
ncbi:TetR/AcrR family transcriptional regulator [Streptomyces sp. A5-4]|uniref:TetR/AcrR family transcriptional regulator n=1 Tax=Streptomyces sp. A5-4 TaxID=3384771 RepID=UPI003DA7AD82